MKKKGELVFDELIPWIIVLGVLALIVVLYVAFKVKGDSILEFFQRIGRFGG